MNCGNFLRVAYILLLHLRTCAPARAFPGTALETPVARQAPVTVLPTDARQAGAVAERGLAQRVELAGARVTRCARFPRRARRGGIRVEAIFYVRCVVGLCCGGV